MGPALPHTATTTPRGATRRLARRAAWTATTGHTAWADDGTGKWAGGMRGGTGAGGAWLGGACGPCTTAS